MANIRALATAGFLVALGSEAAIAMPPQEVPAEVKSCKAIPDDKERLKCFDGLFGGPSKLPEEKQVKQPPEEKQGNWSIDEAKSPNGSPQVVAANLVDDIVLILRCSAAFAPDAIAFIQSLPDNGKLSIKTTRSTDGKIKEGNFNLGSVSEVRNKIAKACDWANGSVDEPVGSIDHQETH
jgi:hypothetical protein